MKSQHLKVLGLPYGHNAIADPLFMAEKTSNDPLKISCFCRFYCSVATKKRPPPWLAVFALGAALGAEGTCADGTIQMEMYHGHKNE